MTEEKIVPGVSVQFVIRMDNIEKKLPFEEISSRLKPSRTRRYEEFPEVSKEMGHVRDEWILEIVRKTYDFPGVVEEIIDEIREQTEYLVDLSKNKDISIHFSCTIYTIEDRRPTLILEPKSVEYMAKIGAEFSMSFCINCEWLNDKQ